MRFIFFVAMFVALPKWAKGQEVWFTPNVGSVDMLNLFTKPEQWTNARSQTTHFQFYAGQIIYDDPAACTICGNNVFPNFVAAGAFQKLQSWGIKTDVAVIVVKPGGYCTADTTSPMALSAIQRIQSQGGAVTDLVFDEPYWGGHMMKKRGCQFKMPQSADQVSAFTKIVRGQYPNTGFVEIEPYPAMGPLGHIRWINALMARGVPIRAYQLDVDYERLNMADQTTVADLRHIRDYVKSKGLKFGMIYWAERNTDQEYYTAAMNWISSSKAAVGVPDQIVFQSWAGLGFSNPRLVPSNLSESKAYTHTNLLLNGLSRLLLP